MVRLDFLDLPLQRGFRKEQERRDEIRDLQRWQDDYWLGGNLPLCTLTKVPLFYAMLVPETR